MAGKTGTKTIAQNKKAYHDYFVEESLEAGIELVDHFIVAGDDMVSMAESGILKETL